MTTLKLGMREANGKPQTAYNNTTGTYDTVPMTRLTPMFAVARDTACPVTRDGFHMPAFIEAKPPRESPPRKGKPSDTQTTHPQLHLYKHTHAYYPLTHPAFASQTTVALVEGIRLPKGLDLEEAHTTGDIAETPASESPSTIGAAPGTDIAPIVLLKHPPIDRRIPPTSTRGATEKEKSPTEEKESPDADAVTAASLIDLPTVDLNHLARSPRTTGTTGKVEEDATKPPYLPTPNVHIFLDT
jgi:hypothetical protein